MLAIAGRKTACLHGIEQRIMKALSSAEAVAASSAKMKEKAASCACSYMTPHCLSLSASARLKLE